MWHETLSRQVLSRGRYLRLLTQRCLSARGRSSHRAKAPASASFALGGAGGENQRGFTLIETLVAISILTAAVASSMTLTTRSLSTAYYARDQVTAFHLAQEAVETVRHVRDGNILSNALGTSVDLLAGIPSVVGAPFIVDTRDDSMEACPAGGCPPLKTDGELYGHEDGSGWTDTRFVRSVTAEFVDGSSDEVRVSVTVSWQSGSFQARSFTISENLYRWVEDGSAI